MTHTYQSLIVCVVVQVVISLEVTIEILTAHFVFLHFPNRCLSKMKLAYEEALAWRPCSISTVHYVTQIHYFCRKALAAEWLFTDYRNTEYVNVKNHNTCAYTDRVLICSAFWDMHSIILFSPAAHQYKFNLLLTFNSPLYYICF